MDKIRKLLKAFLILALMLAVTECLFAQGSAKPDSKLREAKNRAAALRKSRIAAASGNQNEALLLWRRSGAPETNKKPEWIVYETAQNDEASVDSYLSSLETLAYPEAKLQLLRFLKVNPGNASAEAMLKRLALKNNDASIPVSSSSSTIGLILKYILGAFIVCTVVWQVYSLIRDMKRSKI